MLALFALAAIGLVVWGRAIRRRDAIPRRVFAVVILVVQVPFQVYSMLPPNWELEHSLPFHLCDLAWIAAACALWTRSRWACGLVYYWGLTLTSQGLVTPALEFDFPHAQFWMFWCSHLSVILAAIFITWGLGQRPGWREYRLTLAVTLGWTLLVLGFNALAGTNYLFVNAKPEKASILDALGPWPLYVVAEIAIVAAVWAAITWPWTIGARARPRADSRG